MKYQNITLYQQGKNIKIRVAGDPKYHLWAYMCCDLLDKLNFQTYS